MATYGAVSWEQEKKSDTTSNGKDFKNFPFVRLTNGDNDLRLITNPYLYRTINYRNRGVPENKGKKLKIAYPGKDGKEVSMADDPALKAGFSFKSRYYAGVIDRKDNQVKIIDISSSVSTKLKACASNPKIGDPRGYDVSIVKNDKGSPTEYYNVVNYSKEPLSDEDQAMVDAAMPDLIAALERLSAPLDPETLLKKMEDLGYTGGVVSDESSRYNKKGEVKEAKVERSSEPKTEVKVEKSESDYNFDSDFDFDT